jgi:hypothetical protein
MIVERNTTEFLAVALIAAIAPSCFVQDTTDSVAKTCGAHAARVRNDVDSMYGIPGIFLMCLRDRSHGLAGDNQLEPSCHLHCYGPQLLQPARVLPSPARVPSRHCEPKRQQCLGRWAPGRTDLTVALAVLAVTAQNLSMAYRVASRHSSPASPAS